CARLAPWPTSRLKDPAILGLSWRSLLLAGPDDAGHPVDALDGKHEIDMRRIERGKLDGLGGASYQDLGHHLAVDGAQYDAVAFARGGVGRHNQDVAIAVERLHAVAVTSSA